MRSAPYGSWKSPITADVIVSATVGLSQPHFSGDDICWLESRPSEGGRNVIVRRTHDGSTQEINPPPFNARTRVHEYGGASYVVSGEDVYFSNFGDQRLYIVRPGSEPQALTHNEMMRYADAVIDSRRNRIICVREDHTRPEPEHVVNTVAAIDLTTGDETVLVEGNDFYAYPRVSPDGEHLCWIAWNHPQMPWDGTELHVARLGDDGKLVGDTLVAGGLEESIFQPEWSPDAHLCFASDRSGFWNLYRTREPLAPRGVVPDVEPLWPMEAEFGQPMWQFGFSTYDFDAAARIVCAFNQAGSWHIATLDLDSRQPRVVETPFTRIDELRCQGGKAVFFAGSPASSAGIFLLDLTTGQVQSLKLTSELTFDTGYISVPEAVEFPTADGLTAHGFYYAPHNADYESSGRPPLIVMSHGGPTAAATPTLRLGIQYWTSRGLAVLDVNYGGSTGYGRAYRERLRERWGIVDVVDCVNGARYLVGRGLADPERLAITGGSAGGYTTLCALAFHDVFKAGASHYGVADLEALARDTHKFESRYLDSMIGPYNPPLADDDPYMARSPIHHVEGFSCPVIFFQGLEDAIVPPNQAETMVEALRGKGIPVAYLPFEGEQHGFRRAENIKRSLEAELHFYGSIFGFGPADEIDAVSIENLRG
jgi:dipeptidyl aminopeptidase/acylaminoacyl peptidase